MPLLEVTDLGVALPMPEGPVHAVRGVSFQVEPGRTLAIVGESGAGKSVLVQTVMGLTRNAWITGSVRFAGVDVLDMPARALRAIRGSELAMVFQNPFASLHPCHTVGAQVAEVFRIHRSVGRRAAREQAVALLHAVGIANAATRARDFPHQFSGGMLQRVMIAMAIALRPRLLIADEPTTALDPTVQEGILGLLRQRQEEHGTALILVTHDLGMAEHVADDVLVMYGGRTMEYASRGPLYGHPHHPYTRGLLRALPSGVARGARLEGIPGQPADAAAPPRGCPFHPRCGHMEPRCHDDQPMVTLSDDPVHRSACWLPAERVG